MAWCPFATKVPVVLRNSQKRSIRPAGLVLHTAVSDSQLLKPSGEVRWHFYCNEAGELFQFFDTEVPASCQADGNYWKEGSTSWGFISVETWDGARDVWDGQDVRDCPPWTARQVESLAKLYTWLHKEHGVPLAKATGVRGRGLGVHNDFTVTEAQANSGALHWNVHHACPTAKRKAQRPAILARAIQITNAKPTPVPPPKEEEDIVASLADLEKLLTERLPEVWDRKFAEYVDADGNGKRDPHTVADTLYLIQADQERIKEALRRLVSESPLPIKNAVEAALKENDK